MLYEPVIGLEVHAQLLTKSKMFCSCRADYSGAAPNSLVCPVCLGMPGGLPVANQQAVEFAIMTALALNCTVQETNVFARKSYFYPDLPKNYQISQYDLPLSRDGWLAAETKQGSVRIGVRRVHLEEDTAKLTHVEAGGEAYSLIDFNRSGMPLMEIVSDEFVIDSPWIQLMSPNGGQALVTGDPYEITWATANDPTGIIIGIGLQYSDNSGSSWNFIPMDTPNAFSYLWTVPAT